MNTKQFTPQFIFISVAILLAALSRFIPHPLNFSPIGAMALFGGALFSQKKYAFIIAPLAMLVSDAIIGFHSTMFGVYLGFLLITLIGFQLRNNLNPVKVTVATVLSGFVFFVVSNLGVWLNGGLYPLTTAGLLQCFTLAVPFYPNTLGGDLFYSFLLFGSYYLVHSNRPAWLKAN